MKITQIIIMVALWGMSPLYGNWETFSVSNFAMTGASGQYGQRSTKIDASPSELRKLNKSYWYTYFSGTKWYDYSDFEGYNSYLGYGKYVGLVASYNAGTGVIGGSQLVKKFELPQSIIDEGATKVRMSFGISKLQPVSFDPNVRPWNDAISPSLLGAEALSTTGSTVFNLYIVSLNTEQIIYSEEGTGSTWYHSGELGETLTASFILEGSNLYANGDGYALVVESFYEGTATQNLMDNYLAHSFKFEYLAEPVPEPATTGFTLLGLTSLLIRRRR